MLLRLLVVDDDTRPLGVRDAHLCDRHPQHVGAEEVRVTEASQVTPTPTTETTGVRTVAEAAVEVDVKMGVFGNPNPRRQAVEGADGDTRAGETPKIRPTTAPWTTRTTGTTNVGRNATIRGWYPRYVNLEP